MPDAERKIELAGKVVATVKVPADLLALDPKTAEAKSLRDSMGRDLEHLEQLSSVAAAAPIVAMLESWAIVKRVIVQTAGLYGYTPSREHDTETGATEATGAILYLATSVLNSQGVLSSTYALAYAIKKIESAPPFEIPVKDAQDFIKYCMAIVAELSLAADKLLKPDPLGL